MILEIRRAECVSAVSWRQPRRGEFTSASNNVLDLIRRDQDAYAPKVKVADLRQTVEEGQAIGRNARGDEVFSRIGAAAEYAELAMGPPI